MNHRVWKVALITLLILGMLPLFAACSEKVPEEMEFQLVGDGSSYGVRMDEDYYLSELVIPSKYKGKPVTEILPEAIESAPNLEKVVIPSSIEKIGKKAFSGCKELDTVCITDLDAWFAIEFESDTSNPLFYGADLLLNDEPVTSVTLPDDMTKVPDYLFRGCKSLTSVTVPEGVTSIGKSAFHACTSLVTVKLPSSLKTVEAFAFCSCEKLKLESLPAKLSQIGDYAFSHCMRLTSVEISANNVNIGRHAFSGCKKLTTFTLSGNNAHFADFAFEGCTALTKLCLPNSITKIGRALFSGCETLPTVYFDGTKSEWDAIEKGDLVGYGETLTVHCNDGTVTVKYTW